MQSTIHDRQTRIFDTTHRCSSCASRLPADAMFCGMCGHARHRRRRLDERHARVYPIATPIPARPPTPTSAWTLPAFPEELVRASLPAFVCGPDEAGQPAPRATRRWSLAWATMGAGTAIAFVLAFV